MLQEDGKQTENHSPSNTHTSSENDVEWTTRIVDLQQGLLEVQVRQPTTEGRIDKVGEEK